MKNFDLELAKAGNPVCTRDGKPARIICFDLKGTDYPIAAVVVDGDVEAVSQYTNKGEYYENSKDDSDLIMATEKKEGWINIYYGQHCSANIYKTKNEALEHKCGKYITTIKIEW